LTLKDGATRIFLNAKGTSGEIDPDIADFLAYVNGAPAKGQLTTAFADELHWIKERTDLEVEYMTFTAEMMRWKNFGRAEGRAEGIAEGMAKGQNKGETRMSKLISFLLRDGRNADVQLAVTDNAKRQELFAQYNL